MARPRKSGMDYFPHDNDAVDDEKIEAMRAMFGNDGYAFFFILCERIYRTDDARLDISKPILKAATIAKVRVDAVKFEEMMKAAIDIGLFNETEYAAGYISSDGIKKRYATVQEMRNKWRKKKENNDITEQPDEYSNEFPSEFSTEKTTELSSEFSTEKTTQETEGKSTQSKAKQRKALKHIQHSLNGTGNFFDMFDAIWAVYPHKADRLPAQKAFRKYYDEVNGQVDVEWMIARIKRYAYLCEKRDIRCKNGSTFFNQRSFEDEWLDEPDKPKTSAPAPIPTGNGAPRPIGGIRA